MQSTSLPVEQNFFAVVPSLCSPQTARVSIDFASAKRPSRTSLDAAIPIGKTRQVSLEFDLVAKTGEANIGCHASVML
jgi:hypothetical protein